jgi:hypothetical protein
MAISLADSILTSEQQALLPNEADIQFYEAHGWYISPPVLPHDLIAITKVSETIPYPFNRGLQTGNPVTEMGCATTSLSPCKIENWAS